MTEERFYQILEAYGADPAHWPPAERDEAQCFAQARPDLVALVIDDERALDALLDRLVEPAPDTALLERRLLARLPRPALPDWTVPSAVAAALVLGVCLGFASGAVMGPTDDLDAIYADAFTGYEQDWVDWLGDDA
ncbi:hypothetical protein [Maricaulis sp.]|uniref:hypothetical protein n=1 Tax=Maricaulis sp. TaxID=1486257 RepID=UPI002B2714FB|nr:hypothetical protein [Maricaulis sp.]